MGSTSVIPSWSSGPHLPTASLTPRFLCLIRGEQHGIGAIRSEIGFAVNVVKDASRLGRRVGRRLRSP